MRLLSPRKQIVKAVPLPEGTLVEHYKIRQVLGIGGFSVVYTARDLEAGNLVAVKEYYSTTCVGRRKDNTLGLLSPDKGVKFNMGIKRFFDEGFTLSQIDHPNLVKVTNFFRANSTAYMVMDYESGKDLRWFIKNTVEVPDEAFLLSIFMMVLAGLKEVHEQGYLHLDIKPSNILLRASGNPLLLDLGAAHRITTRSNIQDVQTLTHGYSSPEQHARNALSYASDLYGVAMTMRACITHMTPQSAARRIDKDQMKPLVETHQRYYRPRLLEAIDAASNIEPGKRPRDVDMFIRMLTIR